MDYLKNYLVLGMAALVVTMGLATAHYRSLFKATDKALTMQSAAIEAQKKEAKQKLDAMTAERDQKQDAYNASAKTAKAEKEKFDVALEKARAARPVAGPVRVRIVPGSCAGSGDQPAESGLRPDAPRGPEPQAAASGVLDPAVVGALDGRYTEVELLQRDFNICRADLMAVRGITERR